MAVNTLLEEQQEEMAGESQIHHRQRSTGRVSLDVQVMMNTLPEHSEENISTILAQTLIQLQSERE